MPSEIEKIVIDPTAFTNYENTDINFQHDTKENVIKCTGVEISNVKFSKVSKRPLIQDNLLLKEHIFVPYEYQSNDTATCISMAFQIIFENFGISRNLRGRMEFKNTTEAEEIKNIVHDILETESYFSVEFIDDQITPVELIISDYRDISTKNLVADGFILFIGDKPSVMGCYQLVYSGAIEDAATGVYLLRHVTKVNSFDIVHVNNKTFEWIDKIKYAIDQCVEVLYLISSGDDFCGIMGLVRCLNFEPSEKTTFKCFVTDIKNSTPFSLNSIFYRKQATKKLTLNVLKNGVWGSYRYLSLKKLKENDAHHAFNGRENGDGIYRWYECPRDHICNGLKSDYVYVFYSGFGLNTVPIEKGILSLNREESRRRCGYDYSGVTGTGVRVMGISFGNISLQTTTNHLLTWNIPDTWKLEEAATVPLSYYLAYYVLVIKGHIQNGQSVFIYYGDDVTSLAAISICLRMGCQVYITVKSEELKDFLLRRFPNIEPSDISSSISVSFMDTIRRRTNEKGVDIMMGILSKALVNKLVQCLAKHGHFIHISNDDLSCGDIDLNTYNCIVEKSIIFHLIKLSDVFESNDVRNHIYNLLNDGISKGIVVPLPKKIYSDFEVQKAWDDLNSTTNHTEKVLIKIRDETPKILAKPDRTIKALPTLYFSENGVYIIIGGLGGFGPVLADFLISRGARKIVLNSRRGLSSIYQSYCLKKWSLIKDLTVKISNDDSSNREGAEKLVKFSETLGSIKGIFNTAAVLIDGLFVNQTADNFKRALQPKIYSCYNMDRISRERCPYVQYFVAISSVTSGRGNPGQTNYGMGNSAIERLCEKRRKDGLHALAIQFGPIKDVGLVADSEDNDKALRVAGMTPQAIDTCISSLEQFILQDLTIAASYVIEKQGSAASNSGKKSAVEMVSAILGVKNIDSVDPTRSLSQMGLDSLMASDIKQTLLRNYNIDISIDSIKSLTFDEIAKFAV